jgi:CheY-like chemotaxis protein
MRAQSMESGIKIVIAEDDEGHAMLIRKNLNRAGIMNEVIHFIDGEETLNFFLRRGLGQHREQGAAYLLLLDIRMPKLDGTEVLRQMKQHNELKKIPVIMITTTDDPEEIELCHRLGCNSYVTKPLDYEKFVNTIQHLGFFLKILKVPNIDGE